MAEINARKTPMPIHKIELAWSRGNPESESFSVRSSQGTRQCGYAVKKLCLGILGPPYRANEFLERCHLLTAGAVTPKVTKQLLQGTMVNARLCTLVVYTGRVARDGNPKQTGYNSKTVWANQLGDSILELS